MADYSKFEVLEHIFDEKTLNKTQHIGTDIDFTLRDVGNAMMATCGALPASRSNFVLDLTRKDSGITRRLPQSIIDCGYDLRKKTGRVPGTSRESYCGTFVFRGMDAHGNTIPLKDWLKLDEEAVQRTIEIDNRVPDLVREFLSNDEASLFSVIDYCDILSQVMGKPIYRIQSPMKWQPNEIDGFYVAQDGRVIEIILWRQKPSAQRTISIWFKSWGSITPCGKNIPETAIPLLSDPSPLAWKIQECAWPYWSTTRCMIPGAIQQPTCFIFTKWFRSS